MLWAGHCVKKAGWILCHAYTCVYGVSKRSWIFMNFQDAIYIYILADRLLAGARTAILTVQLVTDTWATQLGECHKWPGLAVGCLRTCSRHLWQKALVCSDLPVLGGSWFRCFKSVLAFEGKQGLTWEVVRAFFLDASNICKQGYVQLLRLGKQCNRIFL